MVRTWRGDPPQVEILPLPISIQDETTKEGTAIIVLEFLVQAGLLALDETKKTYQLGSDWEKRWVMIVGDELSIRRVFEFSDDVFSVLDRKRYTFRSAYWQSLVLKKVLQRVIPVSGDLHVQFHMLDCVYRLYYGGFLQPIQHKLGWKHINGKDAAKTYQNSHRLALLAYQECDRILHDVYVLDFIKKLDFRSQLWHLWNGDEEVLSVWLAEGYPKWLVKEHFGSKDWLRRYICGFLIIMRKYLMFKESERASCTMSQEAITSWFIPVFEITGKHNSKNTAMKVMERWYALPAQVLHQVRVNRSRRQRDIVDSDGYDSPNTAFDELMERMMPPTKKFSHVGTFESWRRISMILMFCLQCKKFVEQNVTNTNDFEYEMNCRVNESNIDSKEVMGSPFGDTKRSTAPTRRNAPNRILVTEILVKSLIHVLDEERIEMDSNHFWNVLDVVVEKVKGTLKHKNDPNSEKNQLLENQDILATAHVLFSAAKEDDLSRKKDKDHNDTNDIELIDAEDVSLFDDVESVDNESDTTVGEDDDMEVLNDSESDDESIIEGRNGNELTVAVAEDHEENNQTNRGKKDKESAAAKMSIEDMNKLGCSDYHKQGVDKLSSKRVSEERQESIKRKKREDHFLIDKLYERLMSMQSNKEEDDIVFEVSTTESQRKYAEYKAQL